MLLQTVRWVRERDFAVLSTRGRGAEECENSTPAPGHSPFSVGPLCFTFHMFAAFFSSLSCSLQKTHKTGKGKKGEVLWLCRGCHAQTNLGRS